MGISYLLFAFLICFVRYKRKEKKIKDYLSRNYNNYSTLVMESSLIYSIILPAIFWPVYYPLIALWWLMNLIYDRVNLFIQNKKR